MQGTPDERTAVDEFGAQLTLAATRLCLQAARRELFVLLEAELPVVIEPDEVCL